MHRSLIIELFGVMCQDSPKNGSHLFSQINGKHHGQIRHLVNGIQRFFGVCPCCMDLPATPSQNSVKMINTFLQGKGESRQGPSLSGTSSSLWSLLYSDPMRSSWS